MFLSFNHPRHLQATELGSLALAICTPCLSRVNRELDALDALSVENNVGTPPFTSDKNYLYSY